MKLTDSNRPLEVREFDEIAVDVTTVFFGGALG